MPKYRRDELDHLQQAYHTGQSLVEDGLLEDALPYFDTVLGRLPRRRRDRVYRISRGRARSLATTDGVLWLPPIFGDALMAKALCLQVLGRGTDARLLLERAVELEPDNPQLYAELGTLCGSQDHHDQARQAFAHAATLEPDNPTHLRALTHLALLAGQFPEAHALAHRALTLEPLALESLHQLAYAAYQLGELDEAITILKRALLVDPDSARCTLRLASVLRDAGRLREAIRCMDAYLTDDPQHPEVLGVLTDVLLHDATAPEFFGHVNRLLARSPDDPSALDLLAWGLYQRGALPEAAAILRRLTLLAPFQAQHYFKLGLISQALNNYPAAMAAMLRALALEPDGDVAPMALEAIGLLDQVQVEQLVTRARQDWLFRLRLQRDPEHILQQAGYLLSPAGVLALQALELEDPEDPPRRWTVH